MEKVEYIRCPRCELNYILKKDKLCKVCQMEVACLGKNNELEGMQICPICKANYISDNEDMCSYCAEEKSYDDSLMGDYDREDSWRMYVENDDAENEEDEVGEMCSVADSTDEDELESAGLVIDDLDDEEMEVEGLDELDELDDMSDFDDDDDFDDDFEDDIDDDDDDL